MLPKHLQSDLHIFTEEVEQKKGKSLINRKGDMICIMSPFLFIMAEREGFEPSVEFYPHTRLAGEHHRPLGHLSTQ